MIGTTEQINAYLSNLRRELNVQARMTDAEILAGHGEMQLRRIDAAFAPFVPPQPKQIQPQPTFNGIMSHHDRRGSSGF